MNPARWLPALPGPLLLLVAWASFGGRVVDDAFISLTYAGQLLQGNGLVFHPALEVTEGYSNLLWTLLLAAGLALGLPGPTVATWLGLFFGAATLAVVALKLGGWRGAVVGMVVALSPIFGFWAGQGLEGSLFSLLLAVGVLHLDRPVAWLAFGLLAVTRVEGILYGVLPLAAAAWAVFRGERRFPLWGPVLWLLPFLLQLGFRQWQYGALLPATVVAKVRTGGESIGLGLRWLSRLGALEPMVVLTFAAALLLLVLRLRAGRIPPAVGAMVAVTGIMVYSVGVGGDWMMNLRWLQPAIPLIWYAAGRLVPRDAWFGALVLPGMILAARAGVQDGEDPARPRHWNTVVDTLLLGPEPAGIHPAHLFVVEELRPSEVVLMPDMGQLAWMSGNPVLDPQGLNWRTVAEAIQHGQRRDAVYFKTIEAIQEQVWELSPRIVAIPMRRQVAYGPVAEALLGSADVSAPSWFLEEWQPWRELPQGDGILRYYLKKKLDAPLSLEEREQRYDFALSRVPNVAPLQQRRGELRSSRGQSTEAAGDGPPPPPTETWTREVQLDRRPPAPPGPRR